MPARTKTTLSAVEAGPPRKSTRIAARLEKKDSTTLPKQRDTEGRPAPSNNKEPLSNTKTRKKVAKPPPVQPQNAPQSKKQLAKPRNKKTKHTLLNRQALEQLELETQNVPLPGVLSKYNHKRRMAQSAGEGTEDSASKKSSTYNAETLYRLRLRGIFPQQHPSEKPYNYHEIREAIQKPRKSPPPDEDAYLMYWQSVFGTGRNESAISNVPCNLLFGMQMPSNGAHDISSDEAWKDHVRIRGRAELITFMKAPFPDVAEGLKKDPVPEWIINDLDGLIAPGALAFPNFIMELKRNGSMFTAYAQNIHNGSTAAQAYHEYHAQISNTPEESWDTARVGSIQFNGSIVEGNIHWVSKGAGDGSRPQDRTYHMTRVMHNSTTGLGIEDFVKARREARNFRDYFCQVREDLLLDLRNHVERPASRPAPTAFLNGSESARAKSIIPSEVSTRGSQQRAVAERQIGEGAKRGRGRPRKHVATEPQGVKKRKQAKSKMVNVHTEISSVEGRSTHGTQSDHSSDILASR